MTETAVLTKLCDTVDVSEDLLVRAEIEGFGYAIFRPASSIMWPLIRAHTGRRSHMQMHLKFVPYPRIIA